MNYKILSVLFLFFILLCLNVSAETILNSSFETQGTNNDWALSDTDAKNWRYRGNNIAVTKFNNIYFDTNGQCYGSDNINANHSRVTSRVLATSPAAFDGSYILQHDRSTADGAKAFIINDYYISTLSQDLNICFKFREDSLGDFDVLYGIYRTDTNTFCTVKHVGTVNSTTAWVEKCGVFDAGIYNGYFTIASAGNGGAAQLLFIDSGEGSFDIGVDLLNFSPSEALAGAEVTFAIKVLRTDLNQFIDDANVFLTSNDVSGDMIFNSVTQNYELPFTFSLGKLGAYSFDVNAIDSGGDLNFVNNTETFSLNFIKESSFLSNISNTTILSEFQFSDTKYKGILQPVNSTEDLIYLYNGTDENGFAGTIDFNFLIYNSDLSGKRYFIYTATENEFLNNIWSFDSTLTFGSTIYNGLQKIWIDQKKTYFYSFQDSALFGNEKKYYKLVFRYPAQYWDSLNPSHQDAAFKLNIWDIQFLPSVFVSEAGHKRDFFGVSQFNNMRNQFKEEIPDINSNTAYSKFLLAFNGSVESGTFSEQVGRVNSVGIDTITNVTVSTNERTFYVNSGNVFPLMKGDSASYVNLMNSDYALIERGFFLEPLDLRNKDGTPIEAKLVNGVSAKVIKEGAIFRVRSRIFNRDNELEFIEGKVYFGAVDPSNQVAYFKRDLNFLAKDETFLINWEVDGIIDLNGVAARDFVVVLRATNKFNNWFEIQTGTFKLEQFPQSFADFSITGFLSNKLIGEHLKGDILIHTDSPETLRGVQTYLFKLGSQNWYASDYNKVFYKDTDFTCAGFNCNFSFEFTEHVFDSAETWVFIATGLLTTMLPDVNNHLTTFRSNFPVNFIDINYMRIVQTIERPDGNYRSTEVIPLTLILKTTDLRNTKEELNVKLIASSCGIANPVPNNCYPTVPAGRIDINYSPQSHLYDASTGTNFYFWRQVFVTEDGVELFDDTYYRFYASVEHVDEKIDGTLYPLLTKKCQTNGADYRDDLLGALVYFFTGDVCNDETDPVVTLDQNAHEFRLHIDNSFPLNSPSQECFFCVNADNTNNYVDNLEQDLFCGSWYTFNTASINRFDFYLTNKFSDLSLEGNDAQYIKTQLPFELIAFNDLILTKKTLAKEFDTEADTIGELAWQGLNYIFTGFANPLSDAMEDFVSGDGLNAEGVISNVGYDCNFSRPLDPTFVSGMLFYKIKGIKVINQQDMILLHSDLEDVETNELIKFMNFKGYDVPRVDTIIEVYGSDMTKLKSFVVDSPLVINEEFSDSDFRKTVNDENQEFETLPSKLRFSAISDLVFDNELTVVRRYVPFTITAVISQDVLNLMGFLAELVEDPIGWAISNWFLIILLLVLILFVSVVVRNFKRRG